MKKETLHPLQCSHRVATIAADMAYMNAKYLDTLSQFVSTNELFHLQMNLMYCLIDIMGATANADPEFVLEEMKHYFKNLNKERGQV